MQPNMNLNISELVSSTINISFSYVYFKIAALIDSLDILKNKAKNECIKFGKWGASIQVI